MTRLLCLVALVFCVLVMLVLPARAQSPVEGALATLAAATAQAAQVQAAQRATAQAVSVEATRQATIAQATRAAQSAVATRVAGEATQTAQAQSARATQAALDELDRQRSMTAEAQSRDMAATATVQAIESREREQQARTYAERQDRFTFGLLLVELAAIAGACWVLWQIVYTLLAWLEKWRPRKESPLARLIESKAAKPIVIDAQPNPEPRMPEFVQVVDDPAMVEAIDRWAEDYDRRLEHDANSTDEHNAQSPDRADQ